MLRELEILKLEETKNKQDTNRLHGLIDYMIKYGHLWLGRTHEDGIKAEEEIKQILSECEIRYSVKNDKLTFV